MPREKYISTLSLVNILFELGPLSVTVDAGNWDSYGGGIFDGCPYTESINLNHAVQLVGYGTDPDHGDFWLIKNSFNIEKDEGYMKLKRNAELKCGRNLTPLQGTACQDDGVEEQKVCGTCGILFESSYPIGAKYVK